MTIPDCLYLPPDTELGKPNCGVVATCIAARVPYERALLFFITTYKKRGNWKGATYHKMVIAALDYFGIKYKFIELDYQLRLKNLAWCLNPNKRYMVWTTRHVQIVHGNYFIDQSGIQSLSQESWQTRKNVVRVLELD